MVMMMRLGQMQCRMLMRAGSRLATNLARTSLQFSAGRPAEAQADWPPVASTHRRLHRLVYARLVA